MEATDLILIERHKVENHALDRLWRKHQTLETKISELEKMVGNYQFDINKLKKEKLLCRDQIEEILAVYRS